MRSKKSPNGYTLPGLRFALEGPCALESFTVPSLITLKGWSSRGDFAACRSLNDACKAVLLKIRQNPSRYAVHATPAPGKHPVPERTQSASSAKSHTSKVNVAEIEAKLDRMAQQIQSLMATVESLVTGGRAGHQSMLATAPGSVDPKLLAAIDQLDGVRKHLMVRMDNEMQLHRRVHGDGNSLTPKQTASTDLDIQKILSKLTQLSNVNDRLGAIEQLLARRP